MPAPLLLAALLAADPAAAAAAPFTGCTAIQVPEHGWRYLCDALEARGEDQGGSQLKRRRALWEDQIAASLEGELERWAEPRRLAGQDVQVRRFRSPAERLTVWATALALPEGTRLLRCEAPDGPGAGARCAEALEVLAAQPWRTGHAAGAVDRTQPLRLGGAPVAVPSGCSGEFRPPAGGLIDCPYGYFARWWTVPDEAEGRRQVASRSDRTDRSLGLGAVFHDAVACTLAGAPTTCQRWLGEKWRTHEGEPESRVVLLLASVRAGDQVVVARCFAPTRPEAGTPCRQLFLVKRTPRAEGAAADQEEEEEATPWRHRDPR